MAEVCSMSKEASAPAAAPAIKQSSVSVPELQEYSQLQERYLRTTNALASAAHDLKTPLAILNGYVELLQSEKLGGLNEKQREILRDMRSNGQRLQRYIQDFLSFSVLETGELKMRFEAEDINACLSEVCRLWSPRFQERGLALYHLEIFDDFFRLPTNEKSEGMGLGLAIARRLVQGMGGKIWVESEAGAGCKFSFIVPLKPPAGDSEGRRK